MTPGRGEVIDGDRRLAAADLSAIEERVLSRLRQEGVGGGARIAVAIRDSALFLMTAWAAQATGAVVVLLSSGAAGADKDVDGVGACLVDCEPDVVLMDEAHAARLTRALRECGADAFTVAADGTCERIVRAVRRPRTAHPETAAIICYTSGTERLRKGVVLSRATAAHLMDGAAALDTYTPGTTFLACLPLTHMFGFNHTSAALRAGGRVVVCPDFNWIGDVMDLVARTRVTAACLVPHQFGRLVAHPAFPSLTHLARIWLGASQVIPRDVEAALRLAPQLAIGNIYGLTEALRASILWPDEIPRMLPSVGRPTPGTEIEIRDPDGAPIRTPEARGVAHIRGPTVMLGYWKRDAETRAALDGGWLATGDVMRRSSDGYLWLEGRSKQVFNIAGEKLSPEVLEHYIAASCPIAAVATVAVPRAGGPDEIVAVVVPRRDAGPGTELTLSAVQAACEPHVLSGFVPRRLVMVDELPRNTTGKLDRAAVLRMVDGGPTDDPRS